MTDAAHHHAPAEDDRPLVCRGFDDRIAALEHRNAIIERKIDENTVITEQVRDILASFRGIAFAAKWLTAVGGFFVMAYHGWQKITGR